MAPAVAIRFLDPAVLARIGDLDLIARTVVDGFMHGLHRAPRLGHSTDFAEHRQYLPGDDIRRIDWRVYGRTDRFYLKQFEADTNASVLIAVDRSRSMDFGTGPLTKFGYARFLAATLAWFSQRQGDRVGLALFSDSIDAYVPSSTRHLSLILQTLERATPTGVGPASAGVGALGRVLTRAGIVVLISDWYEAPDELERRVGELTTRGHDVMVIQVLDPAERSFPYDEAGSFEDLESGDRLAVVPEALRDRYREQMRLHLEELERGLGRIGADYALFDTSMPLDGALFNYLHRRQALARVR